jgi:uncharacterized protein (TIGR03067 family)
MRTLDQSRFLPVAILLGLLSTFLIPTEQAVQSAPRLKESHEEKLAGTWKQTFSGFQGADNSKAESQFKNHWVITTEKIAIHTIHGASGHWTYKLDASKTPAEIDLSTIDQYGKPVTYPSIYKIEGDTLTLCLQNYPERGRPKDFEPKADSGIGRFVYVRGKEGDEKKVVVQKAKQQQ